MARVYSETSDVTSTKGVVIVDGLDGVAISLTPEAAAKIGADLLDNAAEAKGEAEIDAARKSSR